MPIEMKKMVRVTGFGYERIFYVDDPLGMGIEYCLGVLKEQHPLYMFEYIGSFPFIQNENVVPILAQYNMPN